MKKFTALLAVGALSLSLLAGCGQKTFKLCEIKTDKYVSTLGQYRGLTVEAEPKTELDEDSYEYFNQYMFAEFAQGSTPADYEAQNGDTLILDYEGKLDGVPFDNGSAQGTYLTLGSKMFIPGFEEALIGIKAGETWDIDVTFPDPYSKNTDLSGKPVVFTCTVHSIVPEYSDEAIARIDNPNFSNVEEYKAFVRNYVDDMINDQYRETVVSGALAQIEASTVVKSIPEELLEEQRKAVITSYTATATQLSMSVDDMLKQYGTSVDEQAEKYAKRILICQTIANIEKISVSDEEVAEGAQGFVDEAEGYDSVEQFYEEFGYEYYRNYLMSQKVYDLLLETANVVAPGTVTGTTQETAIPATDDKAEENAEEAAQDAEVTPAE